MNVQGISIFPSPLLVRMETRRVRGGHLNCWLIRTQVPVPYAVHDRIHGCIYMHPSLIEQLKKQTTVKVLA